VLALALVSLVLKLRDDATVKTTPILCKMTLIEIALLENSSSGVGEGSVEALLTAGLVGRCQIGMSRGFGVHRSR